MTTVGGRKLLAMGATTAVGSAALFYWTSDTDNLLVPTVQATTRFARLAGTCASMLADYKLTPLWTQVTTTRNNGVVTSPSDDAPQRQYWQQERSMRQDDFDKAQEAYATNSVPELSIRDRVQTKRQEKQAMVVAAERLAEAEDQLTQLQNELDTNGDITQSIHTRPAQRLLHLCQTNRGVYIKVGQHLANLDYLLPREYITTLSALYDDNPVTPYTDICRVIEQDLGSPPDQLFDRFDPVPIASASLAQVHVAYKDGTKLAVKVQHWGLRETSRGDIYSLVSVVRLAERWIAGFSFGWLADEIAPNLPKELDFVHEGRNAERARDHLQQTGLRCVIPQIIWSLTSPRVLTMEFEEGFKATDVQSIEAAGLRRHDVSTLISSVFASQVFESGHVHCDPHEGNVLLRANERGQPVMVLVDHGLYKTLDADFRLAYARLWKSLMLADLTGIEAASRELGIVNPDAYRLFAGILLARPFDEVVERSKDGGSLQRRPKPNAKADRAIIRGYAQRYLPHIMDLLSVLPRQMLLLLKMNDCLRHIDYTLGSPANTLLVTGRYAARALYQHNVDHPMSNTLSERVWDRWHSWWSYLRVVVRIQCHEMGLWWLRTLGRLPTIQP